MLKIGLFFLGYGLTVIGSIYVISYLNLLSFGYNFLDYVNFIIRRIECINLIIGIILIIISVILPGGKKNELYIWYTFKL